MSGTCIWSVSLQRQDPRHSQGLSYEGGAAKCTHKLFHSSTAHEIERNSKAIRCKTSLSLSLHAYHAYLFISVYLCLSFELCFGLFRKGPWMALVPGPPYAVRSVRKRRPLLVSESKSVAAWKSCSVLAKAKANEVDCGLLTILGKHYANTLPIKHRKRPVQVQQRPVQVQQTCQTSWTVR